MQTFQEQIRLNPGSLKIVQNILKENTFLKSIFRSTDSYDGSKDRLRQWVTEEF